MTDNVETFENPTAHATTCDTDAKKLLAIGRDKNAALAVIAPRTFGAAIFSGRVVRRRGCAPMLIAQAGSFQVYLSPTGGGLWFRIDWREQTVMKGEITLTGLGAFFGGRLSVWEWKRGDEVAAWQSELFDVFPADCDRLLNLPIITVPDVVAEILNTPVYEMRHIIWGAPHTQTRKIAAQLLWLGLADCCARAGRAGLSTREFGTAALEFALGVLALNTNKEGLRAVMGEVLSQIDSDSLSVVKASRDRDIGNPHLEAGSWIRELSGLGDAPAFWASQQVRALGKLKLFVPPPQKSKSATGSEKSGGKRVVVPRPVYPVIKHS